jgi:hypothetical protein
VRSGERRWPSCGIVWLLCGLLCSGLCPRQAAAQDAAPAEEEEPADKIAEIAGAKLIRWNPLTTMEEQKALKGAVLLELDPALRASNLSQTQRDVLRKHLRGAVHAITLQENLGSIASIIDRQIMLRLEGPTTTNAARDYGLSEVLAVLPELLAGQPEIVQYNAVLIAARLNSKPGDLNRGVAATPYAPAHKFLLRVLSEEGRYLPCRIMAANGLNRYLLNGAPSGVEQSDIAVALAAALQQRVANQVGAEWYRFRLVQALGNTGRVYDIASKPVMLDSLLQVVASPSETFFVRATAARSISQLPFDANTNIELINHEIAKLVYQMGQAFNAAEKRNESRWRQSFFQTYMAYRSSTKQDQEERRWGLLFQRQTRDRPKVEAAYSLVLPVCKPLLETKEPPQIPAARLEALKDWLSKNQPSSRKATPTSDDLTEAPASVDGPATSRVDGPAAAVAPLSQN